MSVKIRDEFSPSTKKLLAGRVGHRCSNPGCRKPTIGPASDITKVVILGDAAHITAASPGGPRYDPELSTEERRHYNNGIWCCPGCAELIDKDATGYPVEVLRHWKTEAEGAAKEKLERAHLPANLFDGLDVLDDYLTVPEVAEKLRISETRVYKWALTGKLLLSAALRDDPPNYDDVRYEKDEHGDEVKVTTEHRTVFAWRSPEIPAMQILYIHPRDVVAIIQNKNPERTVRISRFFFTHELLPKKGIGYFQPREVDKEDLVVTREELNRFILRNIGLL
jgi:hypothetical protein